MLQAMYTDDYRGSGPAVLYSIQRCGKELTVTTNVDKQWTKIYFKVMLRKYLNLKQTKPNLT